MFIESDDGPRSIWRERKLAPAEGHIIMAAKSDASNQILLASHSYGTAIV
jgi:hypothetical protein